MKSIHAAVAREPRIAHGIGFKSRHLTGGTDSPREPNAVDAEMRAQIPAAPALDIAEVDQGVVHRRLLRAAPIGTPRIKGPARTRRTPAATPQRTRTGQNWSRVTARNQSSTRIKAISEVV